MNIPVNEAAPVLARNKIAINVPPEIVWKILTNIDDWPLWQKSVTRARLNGDLMEGATFDWSAGGVNFKSEIHTIALHQSFGWTGKTTGASAIHNWRLIEENRKTIVTVEESLQGILPGLFKKYLQEKLEQGMLTSLEELKAAAESKTLNPFLKSKGSFQGLS